MRSMPIVCLGLSHRTASVDVRERLSCSLADWTPLFDAVAGRFDTSPIREIALISTCNRLEIYATVDTAQADPRHLLIEYLASARGVERNEFSSHIYYYSGLEAAEHLFSVAAGLDSLILGEPQILGQVGDAYTLATEAGTIGPILTALFRAAIRAGKRARTETTISSRPASVSSVAIAQAQEIVGDLRQRKPLIVGMGEMGQLAMQSLKSRGVTQIMIANRTRETAQAFADGCSGNAYTMAELVKALVEADVVISATAAPHLVIYEELVRAAMAQRAGKELVLFDIAVPRDIDPAVATVPGVHLFDMDDLQGSLDEALSARQEEIPAVKEIIQEELAAFKDELRELSIKPVIVDLRQKAEAIRQRELQRALRHLGEVDEKTLEQLQLFSRSLVNKLLHDPTIRLKQQAANGHSAEYADAIRQLFSLDATTDENRHESF